MKPALLLLLLLTIGLGCGGNSSSMCCPITSITVSPQSATLDHTAGPSANSQQFLAFDNSSTPGIAVTAAQLQNVVWSVSDTVNVSISNSHDQSNINYGRATCINATPLPVMVTAGMPTGNGASLTATATLMCH